MYLTRRQRDSRIIITAKGTQVQSQMFHTWAKARKMGHALMVARGLVGPAFHACPLVQGQGFGAWVVSASDSQVTVCWPCPRGKQTPVCGGALFCSCLSLTFFEFSQGPWTPSLAPHLPGDSGVHCSPGRAGRGQWLSPTYSLKEKGFRRHSFLGWSQKCWAWIRGKLCPHNQDLLYISVFWEHE